MAKKPGSSRAAVEERLEEVEELLAVGASSGRIEIALAKKYGISRRQVRNYITTIDKRRAAETQADAPHRRERILRKIQRLETRCVTEKKYGPAAQLLTLEARLSGAFSQRDPETDSLIAELGAPPQDPTLALLWVQRCMMITMHGIIRNASIDPVLKLRLISEYGGKLGLMNTKTVLEDKVRQLEENAGVREGSGDADEVAAPAGREP